LGKFLSFSDKKSEKKLLKNFEGRKVRKKTKNFWREEKFSWQKIFFKKNFGVRKKLKQKNLQNQLNFF